MKRYREYDITSDLLAEPLQKLFCMENDQKNLLEFIRRIREDNVWSVDGLKFFELNYQDLFGNGEPKKEIVPSPCDKNAEYVFSQLELL